jgi:hypothetical protein
LISKQAKNNKRRQDQKSRGKANTKMAKMSLNIDDDEEKDQNKASEPFTPGLVPGLSASKDKDAAEESD